MQIEAIFEDRCAFGTENMNLLCLIICTSIDMAPPRGRILWSQLYSLLQPDGRRCFISPAVYKFDSNDTRYCYLQYYIQRP